jgi:hypothetical protein
VAYENRIAMEETLERALSRIFGEGAGAERAGAATAGVATGAAPPGASGRPPAASGDLAAQAREHYDRALKAQREGNWALYGEEIEKLGQIIGRMR